MGEVVHILPGGDVELYHVGTVTFETGTPDSGSTQTPERFNALVAFFNADAALGRWQAGRINNDPPYNKAEVDALFEAKRQTIAEVCRAFGLPTN